MAKDGKHGKSGKAGKHGKDDKRGKDAGRDGAGAGPVADLRSLLRVAPGGEPVRLRAHDSSGTPGGPAGKKQALAETAEMGVRLAELQERLFAQSTTGDPRALLIVLQGMDTSGKGGTVKHVVGHLNPSGLRFRAFKAPTHEEKQHPFLWRIRRALPRPGEIGIFDRSHYEDVLIVRVRNLVPRATWSKRYRTINAFEQSLADDGVTIVKVFLHIGHDEQRDRLLERLDNPEKHWKFNVGDIEERALWPDYQKAYEVALEKCSTDAAPWYLVPADRKWYRNWAVSKLLLEHLELMDPQYPKGDFDVEECRARLLTS
ncbi:PPK2 family polyphosphate kinase [Streptomyces sp. NPDC006733]|uniref:polyphosphate kinase 2 family protein n=1 Tax=Streptomyces sp. NPDC006733 TaxID=3155460 RepID=UPI0033D23966